MNSSFVGISILVKSNIRERCLVNVLMNISSQSLRNYLKLVNIYDGISSKKKTDLIEMIVYGYMNGKFKKVRIEDISINRAQKILVDKNINLKSLPGYGNLGMRRKDIVTNSSDKNNVCDNKDNKSSIQLLE